MISLNIAVAITDELIKANDLMLKNLSQAVKIATLNLRNSAVKGIRAPGQGRLYRYSRGGRNVIQHRASVAGGYPATDTGRGLNSIATDFPDDLTGVMGSNVGYMGILNAGSRTIAPRPWLKLAYEENQANLQQLFDNAVKEAFDAT